MDRLKGNQTICSPMCNRRCVSQSKLRCYQNQQLRTIKKIMKTRPVIYNANDSLLRNFSTNFFLQFCARGQKVPARCFKNKSRRWYSCVDIKQYFCSSLCYLLTGSNTTIIKFLFLFSITLRLSNQLIRAKRLHYHKEADEWIGFCMNDEEIDNRGEQTDKKERIQS